MTTTKRDVLSNLTLGSRVAEEEVDQLSAYFVETDQWNKVVNGDVDVVFGPKGAGKSAIYASLMSRSGEMFDRGILLISAELPRGAPAFKDLVDDPPTSEPEFVGLWKLYLLALIGDELKSYALTGPSAVRVQRALADAGLVSDGTLSSLVRAARDYVRRFFDQDSVEAGVKLDPSTGMPIGVTGKVTFKEPDAGQRKLGLVSVDSLLSAANDAITEADIEVWVLLDRLDVAFADSHELEANALRALFRVYLDLASLDRIQLKIFLRSDIWEAITAAGFREAGQVPGRGVTGRHPRA